MNASARSADPRDQAAAPPAGYPVAAVARRLGVAPATLRTWDRRYGLGPTDRSAGTHRRYSEADVARLDQMRRLMLAGLTPADAAERARIGTADTTVLGDPATTSSEGAEVVALTAASLQRGLSRAAQSLDRSACAEVIRDAIARHGVIWAWDQVLVPVLMAVGRRWESTGQGVEVEHVLSDAVMSAMTDVVERRRAGTVPGTVLLACADQEMHSLAIHGLAAALSERGVESLVLAALPGDALRQAVRRTGPAGILLWSQAERTGGLDQLEGLPDLRPAPLVLIAGPGWADAACTSATRVESMSEAVAALARAAGA